MLLCALVGVDELLRALLCKAGKVPHGGQLECRSKLWLPPFGPWCLGGASTQLCGHMDDGQNRRVSRFNNMVIDSLNPFLPAIFSYCNAREWDDNSHLFGFIVRGSMDRLCRH